MTHADNSSGASARTTRVTFDPNPAVVLGQTACLSHTSYAAPTAAAAAAAAAANRCHQSPGGQAIMSLTAGPYAAATSPPSAACRPMPGSFSSSNGSASSSSSGGGGSSTALAWFSSTVDAYIGSQTGKAESNCERRASRYEARRERKLARRGGLYHAFRE